MSDLSLLSLVTTHATSIQCVGYSPDNQLILSSNDMGVVKVGCHGYINNTLSTCNVIG